MNYMLRVIITLVHIVDCDITSILSVPASTLLAPTNLANVLVSPPKIIATDLASSIALNKDTTATSLVAPAISIQCAATRIGY